MLSWVEWAEEARQARPEAEARHAGLGPKKPEPPKTRRPVKQHARRLPKRKGIARMDAEAASMRLPNRRRRIRSGAGHQVRSRRLPREFVGPVVVGIATQGRPLVRVRCSQRWPRAR